MSFLFPSSTITLEAALRDASAASAKVRLRAVVALGESSRLLEEPTARRRAAAALVTALDDDDPAIRAEALSGLAELGDLAPVPALIARLADGDVMVRQHAAIALGKLGDRAAFPPLVEALREGPPELRFQAVTSLAELDPTAAYEPVVAALGDRDPQVVAAAAIALGTLRDGRAVAALAPLLTHAAASVRFEVAWALAQLGDGRGREELAAALGAVDGAEPHPARAIEAAEALAAVGGAEELRLLARAVEQVRCAPEARIVAARAVLALLPAAGADADAQAGDGQTEHAQWQRAARAHLLAALSSRKDPLRGLAIEQLAAVGGPWAVAALGELRSRRRGRAMAEQIGEALAAIAARTRPGG